MTSSDDQQRPTRDAVPHLIKGRCTKSVERADVSAGGQGSTALIFAHAVMMSLV